MINTIIHIADYSATYSGNFIQSLVELESALKKNNSGIRVVFVFPNRVVNIPWYNVFSSNHETRLIEGIETIKLKWEIYNILLDIDPDLIHSHHETYDVPTYQACKKYRQRNGKKIIQVWHAHNEKGHSQKRAISKIKWFFKFFYIYGIIGNHVNMIFVNDYMRRFVDQYCRYNIISNASKFVLRKVVPNGVALSRISQRKHYSRHNPFTFITYGGNYIKDSGTVMKAGQLLSGLTDEFKIIITQGVDTLTLASQLFGEDIPIWLDIQKPSNDINFLLSQADCFILSSLYETFSYAVCEATLYGIPVIQSDIEGTNWNSNNPSTFIFQTTNEQDLCERMAEVMASDPDDLWSKCIETRNKNERYSITQWCDEIIGCYNMIK